MSLKEFDFKLRGMSGARGTTCGPAHERVGKADSFGGGPWAGSQEEFHYRRLIKDQPGTRFDTDALERMNSQRWNFLS
jgi:hypothetical protein